jgi:hypothetical protein
MPAQKAIIEQALGQISFEGESLNQISYKKYSILTIKSQMRI